MKKTFSCLLTIYLLSLTFMPCMDKEVHSRAGMHEIINPCPSGNDHDHQDCCSPLCTCSCCSLPFETAKILIFTQASSLPKPIVFFYNQEVESQYHFSIWEPPKA